MIIPLPQLVTVVKCPTVQSRMAEKADPACPVQHIFITRHGERLDNVDYEWVRRADRPYDPPLTEDGEKEARDAGMRFKGKVKGTPLLWFDFGPSACWNE